MEDQALVAIDRYLEMASRMISRASSPSMVESEEDRMEKGAGLVTISSENVVELSSWLSQRKSILKQDQKLLQKKMHEIEEYESELQAALESQRETELRAS